MSIELAAVVQYRLVIVQQALNLPCIKGKFKGLEKLRSMALRCDLPALDLQYIRELFS